MTRAKRREILQPEVLTQLRPFAVTSIAGTP